MTGARRRILVGVRHAILICSTVLAVAAPAWAAPGDLKLTIGEGRVTLIADSVPVRTILQEWARLGQSQIVNGEKVMGGPVTLRLIDVPEAEALDVVLRSASGYLAAPRPMQMANASQFDRIVILATSRPTTTATGPTPMPQQQMQPQFPANPAVVAPVVEDEDEPEEQAQPNAPAQMPVTAPRPGFVGSPNAPAGVQPPAGQQQQPGPVTAPRPGVIPPQQVPPQQPPPPPRPIPQ
jgi:hypothetical protein